MHITIIAIGTQGDVQPYVALGLGLQSAGYEITIATHSNFDHFIKSRGLDFFAIGGNPRELFESDAGQELLSGGGNLLNFAKSIAKVGGPMAREMLEGAWKACEKTDAVLFSSFAAYTCPTFIEKFQLPTFISFLQPVSPSRNMPLMLSPELPKWMIGEKSYNESTYLLAYKLLWTFVGPHIGKAIKEAAALEKPVKNDPLTLLHKMKVPVINGYSSSIFPTYPNENEWVHVTGYWFLNTPTEWQPDPGLVDFIESGTPPVYLGFGSMSTKKPDAVLSLAIDALNKSNQRGIFLAGWNDLKQIDLPENIYVASSLPHDWLFKRVSAVVHHGGVGTTAAGFRAGVPSIIIPFFADQPYWAQRAYKLGVGSKPIARKRLTADRLSHAITLAVNDTDMRARAYNLGQKIQSEDGVSNAVQAIESYLEGYKRGQFPKFTKAA